MNLLLITFSFPPAGGVGVLRALSLAKYLPDSGIRVDVLTARNAPAVGRDEALLAQVPASVTVHRTWTLDLPFAARKAIKSILTRRAPAQHAAKPVEAAAAPAGKSLSSRLRTAVANLLLPDPQIGWLPFAGPAARRIVRHRQIDAVLITVPPFSSVKLAAYLRRHFPHLPIVVDFRDEWLTTTLGLVSFNSNQKARAVAQQVEAEAVNAASAVVLVTRSAVDELRQRYPSVPASRFHWVANGYDDPPRLDAQALASPDPRITFTFTGTVYGSTDPRPFLAAIAALSPQLRAQLRVRFIGRIESPLYRQAIDSLPGTVEAVGFLPQAEALRQLHAADYALLITHDPINVSAKLYDYLGAGLPIFAVVDPRSDARRLLDESHAGRWVDIHDPAAIAQALTQAIESHRTQTAAATPDATVVASYHRRPLAQTYAQLLQQLVAAATDPTA